MGYNEVDVVRLVRPKGENGCQLSPHLILRHEIILFREMNDGSRFYK
jgi:hypothetical protein